VPLILQGKSVLPAPNICHPLPGTVWKPRLPP
jgi:hypothetical protein